MSKQDLFDYIIDLIFTTLLKPLSWMDKVATERYYKGLVKKHFINPRKENPLTIVENTAESRIAAIARWPVTFIQKTPTPAQVEEQFDIHGPCDPINNIGLIAKIKAIYPEYGDRQPLRHADFYERDLLDEDGGIKDDRALAVQAMFSIVGYRSYLPKRFQDDAEMLFCMALARDFNFYTCASRFNIAKYKFITQDLIDGSGSQYDCAEAIEMLHDVVVAERPIKKFYEEIRNLILTDTRICESHRKNYEALRKLQNFKEVMSSCMNNDLQEIEKEYPKLQVEFLADKLSDALPVKNEPARKVQKI